MSLLTEIASRIKTRIQNHSITLSQIANNLITFAKVQTIGAGKLLGNSTGSAGEISELDINDYRNTSFQVPITVQDCENTTSEITVLSLTIPSNILNKNNSIIDIFFLYNRFQNTGANRNLIRKLKINGSNLKEGTYVISSSANTWFSWSKIRIVTYGLNGNNINLKATGLEGSLNITNETLGESYSNTSGNISTSTDKTITNINYTNNITITLTLQWDTASSNARIRIEQAHCNIIKG